MPPMPRPPRRVLLATGVDDYHYEQLVDERDAADVAALWIAQGAGSVRCYRGPRRLWTMTGEPFPGFVAC